MKRSVNHSKENLHVSISKTYNDLTSPLNNYSSVKQKNHIKNSLKNNIMLKMQMYENGSKLMNKSMNIFQLKAASFIYKIPEFTSPQINFEVSQAVRVKVQQIKNDLVTHLPQIKSSNYNPKKLQNHFNHRSSVLELQEWLKNKLKENPPMNAEESMEYKNMIMGVGMKQLIRIINKRCLEQGKMVEQVWQLTWSICRQIILYLSKRAKKCQEVLQKELDFYNSNCKKNFSNVQLQLIQAKQKLEKLQIQNTELRQKLQQIEIQNHKLLIQNSTARVNQGNYHDEFLKILQQNLAIYLQIGDNSKRNWIKKMYLQISKAKNAVQTTMKQQVNSTVLNKIKSEKVVSDEVEEQFQLDEKGNLISLNHRQLQNQNEDQNEKHNPHNQSSQFEEMKKRLEHEFKPIDAQAQTQIIQSKQAQTQYISFLQTCQIEVQTDKYQLSSIGINTQQFNKATNTQNYENKQKKQKQSVIMNQKKQKVSKFIGKQRKDQRKSSIISANIEERQSINVARSRFITNNSLEYSKILTLTQQGEDSSKIEMIEYVCKQCKGHKSSFQVQLQKSDDQTSYIKQKTAKQFYNLHGIQEQNKRFSNINFNSFEGDEKSTQSKDQRKIYKRDERLSQKRNYQKFSYHVKANDIIPQVEQQNQCTVKDPSKYNLKQEMQNYAYNQYDSNISPQNRQKNKSNSSSFHSNNGGRHRKKRDSTLIHDVSYKKQMDIKQHSNFKENQNYQVLNQDDNFMKVQAKLSIVQKQPYFKFFHDQIIQTNKFYLQEIVFPQLNSDYILEKYFFLVQEINELSETKILLNQKQMNAAIQKNLIPIIVQLLGQVKKSIKNNTVQQTIRNFPSLPYTIMNKFSTKYGVKILAIKNMKILLSSLKKIQTYSQKYKLLRLMLFTDCKAYYSEDLFVYLMIISIMDPFIQIDKTINYEEINQLRLICQTHLTTQKQVYQEFNRLTKEQLGKTKTQSTFTQIKLAPLVRSIITSYRMMKINKIQELGFIFFILRKDNHVDYNAFSFFISCLDMDISIKVKVAKTFLANCDLKLKNNKMAISQSGYSKFLIRCPQFTFQYLKRIVEMQKEKLQYHQKSRSKSQNISEELGFSPQKFEQLSQISKNQKHGRISLTNIQNKVRGLQQEDTRISTEKQILQTSRKSLLKPSDSLQVSNEQIQKKQTTQRSYKKKLSMLYRKRNRSQIPPKIRQYSSFTFQIVRFLQNEQESKIITNEQKNFLQDYLHIHILNSQIQQVIGIVDYFSSQMLQIICLQRKQIQISDKRDKKNHNMVDQYFK